MVEVSRFNYLKDKLARPGITHSASRINLSERKDVKTEQKEGEKKFKVEIRDRIEIKDRTYLSTENWIG